MTKNEGICQLKRYKNLLEVSSGGNKKPNDKLRNALMSQLVYTKSIRLFGADRFDGDYSSPRDFRYEKKRLYHVDTFGRLLIPLGFLSRAWRLAKNMGLKVIYVDSTPPGPRSNAYVEDWDYVRKKFSFRFPEQEECLAALAGQQGCIIQAPPGFGKSYLMSAICLLYRYAKIGIVVPDIDNMHKTYTHLLNYFGCVGRVGGGRREFSRVTVYTAGSIHHWQEDTDIMIGDEVHLLVSERTGGVIGRLSGMARHIGLTATPKGRQDGTDIRMEALFGPVIFSLSAQEATKAGMIVPISVIWHDVFMDRNPCEGIKDRVALFRYGIWRNDYRNQRIAEVARLHDADEQVLIMAERVEHVLRLKQYLPEFELCYGQVKDARYRQLKDMGLFKDGEYPITPQKREAIRDKFVTGELKKVISTNIWSTGVSFDRLSVLIRADGRGTPISDVQIPGRVARIHHESGKKSAIVHDFLDQFDDRFRRAAKRRRARYEKDGWQQLDGSF